MSESNTTSQRAIDEQRRLLEKRLPHIADDALNPRGFAHGGWLFTLCDASSGALVFSHGLDCVTQNASINYLHGGWPGDTVDIDVRALHWGRTTIVNEVTLTNQDGRPLAVATMTMYVMR